MASSSKETSDEYNDPCHGEDPAHQGESNESSTAPDISFAMHQNFFPFPFLVPPEYQAPNEATNIESSTFNIPGLSIPLSDRRPLKIQWGKKRNAETGDLSARAPKSRKTTASTQKSKHKATDDSVKQPNPKATTSVKQSKAKSTTASAKQPKRRATADSAKQSKPKATAASAKQSTPKTTAPSAKLTIPKASAASANQQKLKASAASVQEPKNKEAAETEIDDDQSDLVCLHPVHLKPDQIADLEHVIRVGGNFKSTDRRIQEFLNLGTNKTKVTKGTSYRSARTDGLHVHAEDCRIYSAEYGYECDPWPKAPGKSSRIKNYVLPDDTLWDQVHGDGIHPLAFEALRLSSQIPRTKKQKQELQMWSSLELNGTVNIKADDVPQLLLSRAWERAVHAAASFVRPSSFQRNCQQEDIYRSVTLTRNRCTRLGIRLFSGEKSLKCPCCKHFFASLPALDTHFFGISRNTYGCAWRLIQAKEKDLVGKLLHAGVQSQVDTLIQLVVKSVRQKIQEREEAQDSGDLLGWQDVLDSIRTIIGASQTSAPAQCDSVHQPSNPLLDTIQVSLEEPPLLMNDTLLKSIEARLHDRYANIEGKPL